MYHYVYRIEHTSKKAYIGSRTSEVAPKLDLGNNYFSSSTDEEFTKDQIKNPECYKYKITGIYPTRSSAIDEEINLQKFFDVAKNKMYYNKSIQRSNGFDTTGGKLCYNEALNKTTIYYPPLLPPEGYIKGTKPGTNVAKNNPRWKADVSQKTKDKIQVKAKGRRYFHKDDTIIHTNDECFIPPEGFIPGIGKMETTYYHKDNTIKMFIPGCQPEGWIKGTGKTNTKGFRWANNKKINKYIKNNVLPEGFKWGFINTSSGTKGKHFFNNGLIEKVYFDGDQPKDWQRGRIKNGIQ